ncbi:MAG: hypothetical protein WCH31_07380 [Actinomycetes bacterium]
MDDTTWVIVFMLVVLKIPIAYVAYVVWWAVKADTSDLGDDAAHAKLAPWQRPDAPRPRGGGPHGVPERESARRSPRRERMGT